MSPDSRRSVQNNSAHAHERPRHSRCDRPECQRFTTYFRQDARSGLCYTLIHGNPFFGARVLFVTFFTKSDSDAELYHTDAYSVNLRLEPVLCTAFVGAGRPDNMNRGDSKAVIPCPSASETIDKRRVNWYIRVAEKIPESFFRPTLKIGGTAPIIVKTASSARKRQTLRKKGTQSRGSKPFSHATLSPERV